MIATCHARIQIHAPSCVWKKSGDACDGGEKCPVVAVKAKFNPGYTGIKEALRRCRIAVHQEALKTAAIVDGEGQ